MALDDKLRQIQTRISQLNGRKTRAEIELDSAVAKRNDARTRLKEDFGVATGAEAKAKLAELEQELDAAVAEIEAQLEQAGA